MDLSATANSVIRLSGACTTAKASACYLTTASRRYHRPRASSLVVVFPLRFPYSLIGPKLYRKKVRVSWADTSLASGRKGRTCIHVIDTSPSRYMSSSAAFRLLSFVCCAASTIESCDGNKLGGSFDTTRKAQPTLSFPSHTNHAYTRKPCIHCTGRAFYMAFLPTSQHNSAENKVF